MGLLLRAAALPARKRGALTVAALERLSNRCATAIGGRRHTRLLIVLLTVAVFGANAGVVEAQDLDLKRMTSNEHRVASFPIFLAGAAIGLGAHETGHLVFDGIFDAHPGLKRVSFHGIPFFAITHDPNLSNRKEFVIDSAGFWVQHAGNEIILSRNPLLRSNGSTVVKGLFAFNVLASVGYATVGFLRTGPPERDTRGMAGALRWKEPVVAALLLAPAVLDAIRYYRPGTKWAIWSSRGVKVGMVLLVIR